MTKPSPFGAPGEMSTEIATRFAVDNAGNSPSKKRVIHVLLDDLEPDPRNPRPVDDASMSAVSLDELRQTMENGGQQTPIIVGPRGENGKYKLIAGHRRLAAAKRSTSIERLEAILLETMPEGGERGILQVQLLENSHRENPNVVADAEGVARLLELYSGNREQVMAVLGIDGSGLTQKLKVAQASEEVKDFARRSQAKDLVGLYELAKLAGEDLEAARNLMKERLSGGDSGGLRGSVKAARQAAKKERGEKEGDGEKGGAKGAPVILGTRGRAPAVQRVALDRSKAQAVLYIDAKGEQFKFAFTIDQLAALREALGDGEVVGERGDGEAV